ncbi:MAG: YncE family protein [Planctomycetota bacterium]
MLTLLALLPALSQAPAGPTYHLYAAAESSDQVYQLRFDGAAFETVHVVDIGYQATEIEGPHGMTVDPSGEHWYVSVAHGKPNGLLYKYRTGTDELVGEVELGLYPASMQISRDTGFLYCVNFDLHGDMQPSSVSIVDVDAMVEVARTTTGPMPHGSRISPDGRRQYSCAMMSDELIELDTATFEVTRRLRVDDGSGAVGRAPRGGHGASAKPTWVQPHPTKPLVYVALNGAHQIVEVDLEAWKVSRRFPTGRAPYNVDVTPDGTRLVATYKGARAVGVIDLKSGNELARIETTRRVPHGVVIAPDGRFAFVTNEGVGGESGTVDALDLKALERAASVEIGLQAGGIALWKVQPAALPAVGNER